MSESAERPSFGDLLRRYRSKAGFSQDELAQRANVSLAAISSLERGTRRAPQRQTLQLLLDGLRLGVTERAELLDAAARSRARMRATSDGLIDSASKSVTRANLPLYLTSFVARNLELAEVKALTNEHRLVTIVGAGGIGKTRLACEVASRFVETFDRVAFADLAPLIEGDMLAPYLATVVDAHVSAGDAVDAIACVLGLRRVLLILDNCERLLTAAAAVAGTLLKLCPNLRIVATSRERLAISGEWIFRLQPLGVPTGPHVAGVDAKFAPALQLFVDRARAVEPHFDFREADVPDVLEICQRLDGIPLAIELVVARLPSLGLHQLRRRLGELLTSMPGYREAPARHRTMHSTIAWSFDLLRPPERAVLCHAGIFVGGFTLEAAEMVCGDETVEAADVVDFLSRLVEQSLLIVRHDVAESRYRLLEPVRLFCLERLVEIDMIETISRRHAAWLAERADAVERESRRGYTRTLANRAFLEIDNIRAALERLLASGDPDDTVVAARIAGGLRSIWITGSLFEEGERWATDILGKIDVERYPELSALLMRLQIQVGPQPPKRDVFDRAVAIFTRAADYYGLINMLVEVTIKAADVGDFEFSELCDREAERLFASEHALPRIFFARFLSGRSMLLSGRGSFDEARVACDTAWAIAQHEELSQAHAGFIEARARVEAFAGNYCDAIDLQRKALAMIDDALPLYHDQSHGSLAIYQYLEGNFFDADVALQTSLASGQMRLNMFLDIIQLAAAIAARKGELEIASRLEGFYEIHVAAKKGRYRNPLEVRLAGDIDAAFAERSDFSQRHRLSAVGAGMPAMEARTLALTC